MSLLPEGLTVSVEHCGESPKFVGTGVTWEGDYEITTAEYRCPCGLSVKVTARQDVGPPSGLVDVGAATTS